MTTARPERAPTDGSRSGRGEQTRALIVETALRLFRERGYDRTTMRAIAAEAGVSVGNAYYYYDSKEHLIQAFYDRMHEDHVAACAPVLARERALGERLRGAMYAWLATARPYHEFAARLFKHAAEPTSPLSPFSAESSLARDASIAFYRRLVAGSTARVDPALGPHLPELLWLYHMGIVLYWVHDRSPDCARTKVLIDRTVPLVERMIRLARLPLLRPVMRDVVALLGTLRGTDHP